MHNVVFVTFVYNIRVLLERLSYTYYQHIIHYSAKRGISIECDV